MSHRKRELKMQTITSHGKSFFVADSDANEAHVIAAMSASISHTLLAALQAKLREDEKQARAALRAEIEQDALITQSALDSADTQTRIASLDKRIVELQSALDSAEHERADYLNTLKPARNAERITIDRDANGVYIARGAAEKAPREPGATRAIAKGYRILATGVIYDNAKDAVLATGVDPANLSHAPDGTPYYAAYISADLRRANPRFEKIAG
jgi:multidrug efflux pump subunit AcrA (membrane-fusion protein)